MTIKLANSFKILGLYNRTNPKQPYLNLNPSLSLYSTQPNHPSKLSDIKCSYCKGSLTLNYSLSMCILSKNPRCLGCHRLTGPYKHQPLTLQFIQSLLLDLKSDSIRSSLYQQIQESNNEFFKTIDCHRLVKGWTKTIRGRTRHYPGQLPTSDEIWDLMVRSAGVCQVTGLPVLWSRVAHPKLSILRSTFDHKVPLAKGGSIGIDNIQVMPHCMNSAKGDFEDFELVRWLGLENE